MVFVKLKLGDLVFVFKLFAKGCCVLQRCIDYGNSNQKKILLNAVMKNLMALIVDQFGNFVVLFNFRILSLLNFNK